MIRVVVIPVYMVFSCRLSILFESRCTKYIGLIFYLRLACMSLSLSAWHDCLYNGDLLCVFTISNFPRTISERAGDLFAPQNVTFYVFTFVKEMSQITEAAFLLLCEKFGLNKKLVFVFSQSVGTSKKKYWNSLCWLFIKRTCRYVMALAIGGGLN